MTGHALPQVAEALYAQAKRGITTMLPSTDAAWVGAELARRFGLPVWQMAMTATDANRFVLRFARTLTGRSKVLVFDWCYHGSVDEALATVDPDGRTVARPGNIGAAVDPSSTTVVVPFNDVAALEAALATGEIACVLAEPALTNIGIVLPDPGFHDELRRLTRKHGTLLVIDETHTICVGPGGATAAWGLEPDFFVIGKTIGGGMPAAAYGMTAEIADRLGPIIGSTAVDVSGVGGTLTGNALAVAAVRATLSTALREEDFAHMIPLATAWTEGVQVDDRPPRTAVARATARWPRRVLVLPATSRRCRRRGRRRPRARRVHAPVGGQPRHPADAVPQHGADVAAPHRRRRRRHIPRCSLPPCQHC